MLADNGSFELLRISCRLTLLFLDIQRTAFPWKHLECSLPDTAQCRCSSGNNHYVDSTSSSLSEKSNCPCILEPDLTKINFIKDMIRFVPVLLLVLLLRLQKDWTPHFCSIWFAGLTLS